MPSRVRVATYNLYLGADLELLLGERDPAEIVANVAEVRRQLTRTAFPSRVGAVARVLAREQLDLVGLQEVCTWHQGGDLLWDSTEELLAALEALGQPFEVVVAQPSFHGEAEVPVAGGATQMRLAGSNTILRRRGSGVRVRSTRSGRFGQALTLAAMGSAEATIGRGWCAAECTTDDDPDTVFMFVDTHTEAYDPASRDGQRDELLTMLAVSGDAVVLVGDFNSVPEDVGMPQGLEDAWLLAGNPAGPTDASTCCQASDLANPESLLSERIDYVWVRGVDVVSCRRIGAEREDRSEAGVWPSDHAGVAAELELRPTREPGRE